MGWHSRRSFLRGAVAISVGTIAAGCTATGNGTTDAQSQATDSSERSTSPGTTEASRNATTGGDTEPGVETTTTTTGSEDQPEFDPVQWLPKPSLVVDSGRYPRLDLTFWDYDRISAFRDVLHPDFYERITRLELPIGLSDIPNEWITASAVLGGGTQVYSGRFDADQVVSRVVDADYPEIGAEFGYRIFGDDTLIAVAEGVFLVGAAGENGFEGTSLQAALRCREDPTLRYAKTDPQFQRAANAATTLDLGSVRRFDRVTAPTPEQLRFEGCVAATNGGRLGRPRSSYRLQFLFSDPSETRTDPFRRAFERRRGLKAYDDVSVTVDGRVVTAEGSMNTAKYDGHLPGDPSDRQGTTQSG